MKQRIYGTRMGGNEVPFEELFSNYVQNLSSDTDFVYVEIGVESANTFKSIHDIVTEKRPNNNYFVGIDITDTNQNLWINHFGQINKIFGRNINLVKYLPNFVVAEANLILKNYWSKEIDICFIDGCHGYACAMSNFKNVEKFIKKNGYIIFHDAGIPEQNTDYQPHCAENINVRQALMDLGLFENKYPNWEFIKETQGTRKIGSDGNSCLIIKKI